jgi:hypothetical protein
VRDAPADNLPVVTALLGLPTMSRKERQMRWQVPVYVMLGSGAGVYLLRGSKETWARKKVVCFYPADEVAANPLTET